jgi:hypothetical protein
LVFEKLPQRAWPRSDSTQSYPILIFFLLILTTSIRNFTDAGEGGNSGAGNRGFFSAL